MCGLNLSQTFYFYGFDSWHDVMVIQEELQAEKQRADEAERKFGETQNSVEGKSQKLEETEKRVSQLQESMSR